MRYALIIIAFLFCTIKTDAQVYQAMPQAGYGPVKRMLIDSVLTIPIGLSQLRNITGGRDTAQIRYQKSDSSVYVYTGSTWVKLGTGGGGGGSADSTVFFTVYRADTMRANIYGSIPQPDTIYARYPVRISNDTIYLQQAFVDSVYNVSSGDATRLVTTVYNNTGSTITKGSVVYINGRHSSNLPTIALAQANDEVNSYKTFALVETDIPTSNSGTVIQAGRINNLNLPTSTYTDGDLLYLSPTVAGGYTTTKPLAPYHIVKLGSVTRAHPTLGGIEIKIENGWQLDELSDVQIAAVPADSNLLQFSRVDSLWHDVSPVTVLGNRTWKTDGNSSVNSNYFLGSINNASLRFKTFGEDRMILDSLGRLQVNGLTNNTTYSNALQLANKNSRSIFNISTTGSTTHLSIKANNNAVGDSLVIADTGLIQSRSNTAIWLKGQTTGTGNVNVNAWRSGLAGTGSIFSANVGTNAPIFNMLSTGQMSIGAETPASTAALDITSTTRGLLIPRMTTSERNAISTPAAQLLVANTTTNTIDMYQNGNWSTISGDYSDDVVAYRSLGSTIQAGPVPGIGTIQTAITMFTGRGYWAAVYVKKPITITGAAWFQTIAGSYTAANYNGLALYSYSGGTLTLVDSSTRDNTIWTATTATWNSKAFAGGTRTLSPGIYYVAAFYNNSAVTTNPQIGAVYSGTSTVGYTAPLTTNSARISGWETSITTPPSTKTMSSFTGQGVYLGLCLY